MRDPFELSTTILNFFDFFAGPGANPRGTLRQARKEPVAELGRVPSACNPEGRIGPPAGVDAGLRPSPPRLPPRARASYIRGPG